MPANRRPAKARQPPQPCKSIPSCCCSRRWDLTTASNTLTVAWQRMYKLNSNCVQKQRRLILEVLRKMRSIVVLAEFLCQVQDKVKPDQEGWVNEPTQKRFFLEPQVLRSVGQTTLTIDNLNYNCFNGVLLVQNLRGENVYTDSQTKSSLKTVLVILLNVLQREQIKHWKKIMNHDLKTNHFF